MERLPDDQPIDLTAWRQEMRLRAVAQVDRLMTVFEGLTKLDMPLEVERAATALKAIDAVAEQIFGVDLKADDPSSADTDSEEDEMNDDLAGDTLVGRDWRADLERKLHRLAEARRDHSLGGELAGRPGAAGPCKAVDVLGERSSAPP
ncbi:hypothetical protein [Asticcacaulis benevestitus]|uniref:Uncharacterized protein n=1 Tax=Asticcacaulis benevestitus DSM 16100 = ATCC BAA-896 TaxID=1121022 RepID=V4P306_9CAUL|nr:hypothetical protein [Asticcacaulis benevestitus]ESQ88362.1 hypothetical protein ABENE_16050 [Asticcacaulis benevestitus DSM 16100 = ATCC BAA-896]